MRKKLISIILLMLALCLLTVGLMEPQILLINPFYEQMSRIP